MSLLLSDGIVDANLNLRLVGQRLSNTDHLLYFHQANQYFNTTYKMPTSQRASDLLLFPGVLEYGLPTDFLGMFEPEAPYNFLSASFIQRTESELMHYLNGNSVALKYDHENPFLLINFEDDANGTALINGFEDLTSNGTISASGDATAIYADGQIFTEGLGSIGFTVTGSTGVSVIIITAQQAVNLTDFLTNGYVFLDLQNPNTTAVTSIQLKLYSSATAYYSMSATTRYRGNSIGQGWGLIGFNLMNATTTNSPDITNIINVVITITQSAANSGTYRLDNLFASNPTYYQLPYYSKYNVKDTNGTYIPRPLATSDTILCPPEGDQALLYKELELASISGLKDEGLAAYWRQELADKEALLRSKYPKQEMKVQTSYFKRADKF